MSSNIASIQTQISQVEYQISKTQENISRLQSAIAQAKAQGDTELASSQQTTLARQQQLLYEDKLQLASLQRELATAAAKQKVEAANEPAASASDAAKTESSPAAVPTNATSSTEPATTESAKAPATLSGSSTTTQTQSTLSAPPAQSSTPTVSKAGPIESQIAYVYTVIGITSTFSKGKFTQELVGALLPFPEDVKTATAEPKPNAATTVPEKELTQKMVNDQPAKNIASNPIYNPTSGLSGQYVTGSNAVGNYYNKQLQEGTFKPSQVYVPLAYGNGVKVPLQKEWVTTEDNSVRQSPSMTPAPKQKVVREP